MPLAPHTLQFPKAHRRSTQGAVELVDASCSSCAWSRKQVSKQSAREDHVAHLQEVRRG